MALRKEQVLVVVALVLGALVYKSGQDEGWRAPSLSPQSKDYKPAGAPGAPLLTSPSDLASMRRFFREPSETQPLPPRQLPFPSVEAMPLVALPLDPGPDLARSDLLLVPGAPTEGVVLDAQPAAEAAPADGAAGEKAEAASRGGVQETREQKKERYRKQYDQVWLTGQNEEHFGILRAPGQDLYDLAERDAAKLEGVVVQMLEFSIAEEKVKPPESTFGNDERIRVTKVRLADTLKNRVARAVRAVPADAAHALDRDKLIDQLLLWARDDAWVYDIALEQADILAKTDAGLSAVRAKSRVLRAKGDLAAELALYESLPDTGSSASFRFEGLGILQGRLGLAAAAEASLRRAIELAPTDARPHAAVGAFLRQRGQPREAYEMAQLAVARLGSVSDALERMRVIQVSIAGLLGMGDLDAARDALSKFGSYPAGTLPAAAAAHLRASIDYAAGQLGAAKDGFRNAAAAGFGPAAQLGLAACQARLGEWQAAKAGFEGVAADAPLLRHQALAGLSLLYLRVGQYENAATQADRALDADPSYAYAHYLKARALAGMGQPGSSLESLTQVLRLRDDFVAALAEVSEQRMRMLRDGDATDQAENALAAVRYADRAVSLSPVRSVTLYERQGLAHYAAADLRGAGSAFGNARDAAADDAGRLFAQAALAVVDYAQDRVDDARPQLERLQNDLAKEHPIRQWAVETLQRIDDHAQKEQLDDRFERSEVGNVWRLERDGALAAMVEQNRMRFAGKFSKATEVSATRIGAVLKGGKFLAVGAKMELLDKHTAQDTFAGLRIQSRSSGGSTDFTAQVGLRDGKPYYYVKEGKADAVQSAPGGVAAASGRHELELRVLDRGENLFTLVVLMDGQELHRQDLTLLRAADQKELETSLCVSGRSGSVADVAFDDYHLERRKD